MADNGRELARLLAALAREWPVPVERIDLVGHSMGGLVLREVCSRVVAQQWLLLVRTATFSGTPHDGAPQAQGAARLATASAAPAFSAAARRGRLVTAGALDSEEPNSRRLHSGRTSAVRRQIGARLGVFPQVEALRARLEPDFV